MIIRINADTAGRALRELHESRGMSRRAFARQLGQLTMRDPLSVNEQLYEWCRPEHVNGRYPNMMTYETALNALGLQLAIVPVETLDNRHSDA
jgi:hypothetical protein